MQVGSVSGQEETQVFVVEFVVCGERPGLKSGVLERWRSGGYLGGIWEEVAGCGEGDSGGISVGFLW